MALISCPECGREKVSDSAESCPECGYSIKKYFDQKKQDEKIKNESEKRIKIKEQRFKELSKELEQKLIEIENEPYPEKPNFFKLLFNNKDSKLTYVLLGIIITSFFIAFCTGNALFMLIFMLALFIGLPFLLFITYSDYQMFLNKYYKETKDWEGLKKKRKEELIKYYKNKDEIDEWHKNDRINAEVERRQNVLKCPVCKCTKVKRISTANRAISIAAMGLASSKIGKQYECEVCHHKW